MDMNMFNSDDQCGATSENMELNSVSSFGFHFLRVGHSPKGQPGKVSGCWTPGRGSQASRPLVLIHSSWKWAQSKG